MSVQFKERQRRIHHDRRQKSFDQIHLTKWQISYLIRCQQKQTQLAMMMLIPLLCTIICVSIVNSQRSIDAILQWQSQMLLRATITDNVPLSLPKSITTQPNDDKQRLRLRYNYTNLTRYSQFANDIAFMQSNQNCSMYSTSTTGYFWYRNRYGLGSDLHVYSVAICNAMQMNHDNDNNNNSASYIHVQTLLPWIWYDATSCGNHSNQFSAMMCYFPESEPSCPIISPQHQQQTPPPPPLSLNLTRKHGKIKQSCSDVIQSNVGGVRAIRTATTEFLFTRVSTLVQHEGERQLNLVFPNPTTFVPHNLITVHIRWGDKVDEMELVPIIKYIDAVYEILEQRRQKHMDTTNGVHIYLATEDPEAVRQFQAAAPADWYIYLDQYYVELLPHRKESTVYNGVPQMAKELHGRPGLMALGSLLVAMEANDYILTTSSNWSRLMNEIRISIIHPRCNNCTTMIDLKPGEW